MAYKGAGQLFAATSPATVAATSVETSIIGTGVGSLMIPVELLRVPGRSFKFTIRGSYSTAAVNIGTLTIRTKLGSVAVASGVATGMSAGLLGAGFVGESTITVITPGVAGSLAVMGQVTYLTGSSGSPLVAGVLSTSAVSVDLSVPLAFDTTVQWSAALGLGSNSVSSRVCVLEALA